MHRSEQAESTVLICVVYCTVSASREKSGDTSFLAEGRRVASLLLRNPARFPVSERLKYRRCKRGLRAH